jgi:hypothetical protein
MVTAFVRIEGRPVGVIANNPAHLAGAIDADGADKATRYEIIAQVMAAAQTNGLTKLGFVTEPKVAQSNK